MTGHLGDALFQHAPNEPKVCSSGIGGRGMESHDVCLSSVSYFTQTPLLPCLYSQWIHVSFRWFNMTSHYARALRARFLLPAKLQWCCSLSYPFNLNLQKCYTTKTLLTLIMIPCLMPKNPGKHCMSFRGSSRRWRWCHSGYSSTPFCPVDSDLANHGH